MENFEGISRNGEVKLDWNTANGTNFSHFIVQKSVDSSTFKDIGKVKRKKNAVSNHHFNFSDTTPAYGVNYYRLKAVYENGIAEFHEVVGVLVEKQEELEMDPQLV